MIFTLFEYCKSKEHLEQEYISVVAESWKKNNIITNQDLDNYLIKSMEEERRLKRKNKLIEYINNNPEYFDYLKSKVEGNVSVQELAEEEIKAFNAEEEK